MKVVSYSRGSQIEEATYSVQRFRERDYGSFRERRQAKYMS